MNNINFDNYLHATTAILSQFDDRDDINLLEIKYEMQKEQRLKLLMKKLYAVFHSDADVQNRGDRYQLDEASGTCIDLLKAVAESGTEKQKKRFMVKDTLHKKLKTLDEAVLLKHFTSTILVEEAGDLMGVQLNKATGRAVLMKVHLGHGSETKDDGSQMVSP